MRNLLTAVIFLVVLTIKIDPLEVEIAKNVIHQAEYDHSDEVNLVLDNLIANQPEH